MLPYLVRTRKKLWADGGISWQSQPSKVLEQAGVRIAKASFLHLDAGYGSGKLDSVPTF